MRKVKILHIITRLDKGGSAENTLLTCVGLNKNKYDITIASGLTFSPKEELKKEAEKKGVKFYVIPELVHWSNPIKDIQAFWKILQLIRKGKFDIVHTHTSKAGILGRFAAKIAGVNIIIHTPHGHIFYGYRNFFLTNVFIFLEKITAKFTDKIVTLTEKGKEEHLKFKIAPKEKFVTIHSGIRFENFSHSSQDTKTKRRELEISSNSLLIGTAGRLIPVKGHRYLIEAISNIKNEIPNITLLIIGSGDLRKNLENQAKRLNIKDKVKFLGFREDVTELIAILDIFVLPSINEGMGRMLAEAMALAKPVVATEVGGIPDLVINGKTGILVPPKNPLAIANAIRKILKDKNLAEKMCKAAKQKVKSKFTEKLMVEKIDNLYNNLLKEKRKSIRK